MNRPDHRSRPVSLRALARILGLFGLALPLVLLALDAHRPSKRSIGSMAAVARTPAPRPAALAGLSEASDPAPVDQSAETVVPRPSAARAPGAAGMVVGIDPETGQLGMPTTEQRRELEARAAAGQPERTSHSPEGLVEIHNPDGSVTIDLQGRFQEYATVRIGPDGKPVFECVEGAESAKRAITEPVTQAAPARPAVEER